MSRHDAAAKNAEQKRAKSGPAKPQQEAQWRAVTAVIRAAQAAVDFWREEYEIEPPTPQDRRLDAALARLRRVSGTPSTTKRRTRAR